MSLLLLALQGKDVMYSSLLVYLSHCYLLAPSRPFELLGEGC